MTRPDLAELRRLLAEDTPSPYSYSYAEDSLALIAAMRNALPALLDGYEAGRKLRDGVESIAMYGEESAHSPRELVDEYDAATTVERGPKVVPHE